jgi:cation diffusion facilitator family transporter
MIIGLLLIIVGLGISYSAVLSIYNHEPSRPSLFAIYAAASSVIFKEALFWYTLRVGRRLKSLALIGNAWHHRADALSSIAVLAGVGAVYLNPDWYLADSYAALIVTYFVIKVGITLVWAAFKELADTAPDRDVLNDLTECVAEIKGVRQVHDLRSRLSGSQIFVEVHIVVDPELSVRDGHAIAREVKRSLLDDSSGVARVIVHVDPELKTD